MGRTSRRLVQAFFLAAMLASMNACSQPRKTASANEPETPAFSFPNSWDRIHTTVILSAPYRNIAGINGRAFTLETYIRNTEDKTLLTIDPEGNMGVRGSVSSTSTRNQKYDIAPFTENALGIIGQTQIVSYHYRGEPRDFARHVGFIAEDTPEVLSGERHNSINLDNSVAVTMKAEQELEQRTERLQQEITELRGELAELRASRLRQ